jgi:hypothetical protein
MIFTVSVGITGRNITVRGYPAAKDIEPTGLLTHLSAMQFMLIASHQTSLYNSPFSEALYASIGNYEIAAKNNIAPPTAAEAILRGVENSLAAMIDDILLGYASAQLMVAQVNSSDFAIIELEALQLEQWDYVITIAVINAIIILVVIFEAIRTRG